MTGGPLRRARRRDCGAAWPRCPVSVRERLWRRWTRGKRSNTRAGRYSACMYARGQRHLCCGYLHQVEAPIHSSRPTAKRIACWSWAGPAHAHGDVPGRNGRLGGPYFASVRIKLERFRKGRGHCASDEDAPCWMMEGGLKVTYLSRGKLGGCATPESSGRCPTSSVVPTLVPLYSRKDRRHCRILDDGIEAPINGRMACVVS